MTWELVLWKAASHGLMMQLLSGAHVAESLHGARKLALRLLYLPSRKMGVPVRGIESQTPEGNANWHQSCRKEVCDAFDEGFGRDERIGL